MVASLLLLVTVVVTAGNSPQSFGIGRSQIVLKPDHREGDEQLVMNRQVVIVKYALHFAVRFCMVWNLGRANVHVRHGHL
jgi:hypothetical protein